MQQSIDSNNLHNRLKKIVGQVQAIDRMIDQDISCEEVLTQISATKAALHSCGKLILEEHIKHCVLDGIEHGDADKSIEEFTVALDRFVKMS
jgi:CsoR family transcriptional regulator, copper-sensing transcriptional repressor